MRVGAFDCGCNKKASELGPRCRSWRAVDGFGLVRMRARQDFSRTMLPLAMACLYSGIGDSRWAVGQVRVEHAADAGERAGPSYRCTKCI